MNPRATFATAGRVLRQLRHDPRTLAMMLVVPLLLLSLLWWMFKDSPSNTFDRIGPAVLGLFPFVLMFLVTSIATLRERTSGTLERLLAMPIGKLDFLIGYAIAFGIVAVIQASVASAFTVGVLDLEVAGSLGLVVVVALLSALLGMALGLFVSAFARTEFQAVQFMPLLVFPQAFLCGLFISRQAMDGPLQAISDALPLSYAVDAMNRVAGRSEVTGAFLVNIAVVAGAAILALAIGAATLRRRTP
jgi:ABC-2 type transport system permease protein